MATLLATLLGLSATTALAQHAHAPPGPAGHGATMNHGMMNHGQAPAGARVPAPTQPGQAAFAAIQEIVRLLEEDPQTDWSRVDIEALRQHLVDMDNVTLRAAVRAAPVDGGVRFTVTGPGEVRDSIRRMVTAHAATMSGAAGWTYAAAESDDGATLTVIVPSQDLPKLKALGFIGVMTVGMHHQDHHLMIAKGQHPHP